MAARKSRLKLSAFDLDKQLAELEESLSPDTVPAWPLVGMAADRFPLLSEHIDGIRNSIYLFAGASRMGKTAYVLELLVDLLMSNMGAMGVFLSLDQNVRDLNIRLVAQCGEVNMEYLLNPGREGARKYEQKKQRGLAAAHNLRGRLSIVDESLGALRFKDVEGMVRDIRKKFDGPLILAVDPLFKLRYEDISYSDMGSLTGALAREFKTLCASYNVAVLATTCVAGAAGKRRPELADLEEQSGLMYDAHAIGLVYCDYFNDADTTFMEWEWGTDDLMVPVWEINIVKNKMGSFSGRLWYRFYNSFSKFRECGQLEKDNYDRMLYNLKVHDDRDPMVNDQIIGRYEDLDRQK